MVWAFQLYSGSFGQDIADYRGVHIYSVSKGTDRVISSDIADKPIISGSRVFWTNAGSIKQYDLNSGMTTTVVSAKGDTNQALGVVGDDTLIFMRETPTYTGYVRALYSVTLP